MNQDYNLSPEEKRESKTIFKSRSADDLLYTWNEERNAYSVSGIKSATKTNIVISAMYQGWPVTAIGDGVFQNHSKLKSISIPNTIGSIGDNAFTHCTKLTSIVIPNSVTFIGASAFESCFDLTSITIPSGIQQIQFATFKDCVSLAHVYYTGSKAEWDAISIKYNNPALAEATVYYYSKTAPTETKNLYWRYVDGVATPW